MSRFPQIISALFRWSYGLLTVHSLCIKRSRNGMFYFSSLRIIPLSVAIHIWSESKTASVVRFAEAR